jgi:hypothetical protein
VVIIPRTLNGGNGLSNPFVVATLRSKDNLSSDLDIFSPTLVFHNETQTHYLAFWCSGKVFFTTFPTLSTSGGILVNPIQLVAGNNDFTSGSNSANPIFESLVNSGGMMNNQLGTKENDVPQQRVGLLVSNQWPSQGNAFVYYKDSINKLLVRQVRIGDAPGKEMLHPLAVVIFGGLLSSTIISLFLTPALLYRFGKNAVLQLNKESSSGF